MVKKTIFSHLKKRLKLFCIINVFFMIPMSSFGANSISWDSEEDLFSVQYENTTVKDILDYIEKHSKYIFIYSETVRKNLNNKGPLGKNRWNLLGSWTAHGKDGDVVGIYDGLKLELKDPSQLLYAKGCDFDGKDESGFAEAVATAGKADVILLCLGEKRNWSGENASRASIALPKIQEKLAMELKKTGKPIVLILSNGRPLELCRLEPVCDASVEIWQPGIAGGKPLAGILTGRINPSGKLPITFPYATGQIPIYYNRRQSARPHQGKYQDLTIEPLYEFGHGLSYTTFEYGDLKASATQLKRGDKLSVEVAVTNTGDRDGAETVHWFITDPYSTITRPVKELKYFEKQTIRAGETRTFRFEVDLLRDLGFIDGDGKRFLEKGTYYVQVKDKKVKLELID